MLRKASACTRMGLGLVLMGSTLFVGCGPKQPDFPTPSAGPQGTGSNRVSFRLFGYSPSEIRHMRSSLNFHGKVFLARYDPEHPERINWIDCPTDATYRYVSSDNTVEELYIENATDLQAKLPLSIASFSSYLSQGKRLRVKFATAGSFELLNDFSVPSNGACGDATHFVQTISVGAYSVAELNDSGMGSELNVQGPSGSARHSDMSHHNVGMGDLEACATPSQGAPPKNCQMPLEILMVPIGSHRAAKPAPPPAGDPAPTPQGMPRPVGTAEGPAPAPGGVTHENCFAGIDMTFDPERDLAAITSRCGPPLGMVPVGAPMVDELAAGAPLHEYGVDVEPGACYRIFAIGGRGVDDLDTGLKDPAGEWVSKDILDDAFPILNPNGPFCVRQGGRHKLLVAVAKGSGKYAVQLWKVNR
jgi:hypothetical protein